MTEVVVVRTGTANLASVMAGLHRLGVEARLTTQPADVDAAPHLVLPGVGAFGAAMHELQLAGLVDPLRRRLQEGRATLAICLGLQLFSTTSEESPGVIGLGLFDTPVSKFPNTVRVPQLGWNTVSPDENARLVTPGDAYFANSYRLTECPPGWSATWSEHGTPFVAAIERGFVLACQFHPELSGRWGLNLMRRWLGGPC